MTAGRKWTAAIALLIALLVLLFGLPPRHHIRDGVGVGQYERIN